MSALTAARTAARTALVLCPGMCGATSCGETVEANFGTAKATTVRVAACTSLVAQGWTGHQMAVRKTEAATRLTFV